MPSRAVLPACSLVAGVAIGVVTRLSPLPVSTASLILATLLLVTATRWWTPARREVALVCILAFAGVQHGATARETALRPSLRSVLDTAFGAFVVGTRDVEGRHEPIRVRAVLLEDAALRADVVSLRAKAHAVLIEGQWRAADGGLSINVNGAAAPEHIDTWRRGRTIDAPVTFRRPPRYLNVGVTDFERAAALDGLTLFASVKSGLLVEVVTPGSRVTEAAAAARARVRAALSRWVRPHGEVPAAIVTAVLIGDRTGLPDEARLRLQAAGTYHVIAISGGNIAILAALTIAAFTALCLPGRLASLATIAVLLAYAAIVSAGPSVWRATLMAVLYFAARVFDHRTPAWHALTMTAGVIAVVQPLEVRDAGFLLTFGATAGLLAVGRLASGRLPRRRLVTWITASVVASLAAELVLLPVSAGVFSRVTAAGLLLNLIAIPTMALVQVAGMLVVACERLPVVAATAGWTAAHGASALVDSARLVDHVPALVHRVPPPPVWISAAYYTALLLAWRGSFRIRLASCLGLALAGAMIVTGTNPLASTPRGDLLRMTMIDVGQAESLLLEVPGAGPMLIDSGGSPFGGGGFDVGSRVLAPALWARGIRRLGTLVVTHGDPDHIGGATAVLADFQPREFWWGTPVPPHQSSRLLQEAARRQGSVVTFRRTGDEIRVGAARLRVLHPPPPDWERQKVRNDDSLVLEVVYRDVALLLTGDISSEIERAIAPQLTPARVRVLKVAHHGSRSSSSRELLESWRPQLALISAGRGNTFGHPAPEVLKRLESIGARVYRTDQDGQITLESDGRSVSVRTFNGGER